MNEIIFTPPEVGSLTIETLEELKAHKYTGIKSGIADLDKVMLPMRGAELISVIGYTSHYKSGFMNALARHAVSQCTTGDCVIKVTWEQSVEEDTVSWIANDTGIGISSLVMGEGDWELVMNSYQKRIVTPLWIIGHSSKRSETGQKARPRITMTDVLKACELISHGATDQDYKVRMILLDYLQRIRPDRQDGDSKREQIMEAVNKAKDLAISFGCPVVLGVQAGRQILDREYKLPRIDDGQESSNIEQSSDKVISLWYPIKTEMPGDRIEGIPYEVSENLLICGLIKQKLGIAPVIIPLFVNPAKNIVGSFERSQ